MRHLAIAVIGIAFGFALSRIGFSDWGEVHRMFTFEDLRLTLTFAGAVGILTPAFWLLRSRTGQLPGRRLHRGVVPGAILFGMGWALSGACPGIAMVQLGEGQLAAILTLIGIVGGVALHRVVQRRVLRWDTDGCEL
jgi:hypothetical protein